ncbi:P-loop containing nucleoside triphosphate hydrolase protein [Scheffersomyces xylosifermentans]|uniref:P-loop containing nucleoside triphosphate hydrolase protein n=1 Tax=Scheffersomyces xylosifermentans TaxID=1304137 RepID=UPI00315CB9F8
MAVFRHFLRTSKPDPDKKDTRNGKDNKNGNGAGDDVKKPQRGLVIGENFGWTGKLPVTLLNEYCQKQKWGKPVFDMTNRGGSGFISIVHLNSVNPKTKEPISVKFIPKYEPKSTTNEARHMAATYVLYRINFVKNMKMLLPIIFRDYWSELEVERTSLLKSDKAKHDLLFNVNPFQVYIEQQELAEKKLKQEKARQDNQTKVKKPTISIGTANVSKPSTPSTTSKSHDRKSQIHNISEINGLPSFPRKVWDNAPFIDFSSEIRTSLESSIRKHINWIIDNDHPITKNKGLSNSLTPVLTNLGFRPTHIEESFKYTSNFVDVLEWLLFHIPEDDLPPYFCKTEKDSSLKLKVSKDIKLEYLLDRMAQSGFDKDEILTTLEENEYDEVISSVKLTQQLSPSYVSNENDSEEDSLLLWEQEIEGIKMMETNKVKFNNERKTIAEISLKPANIEEDLLIVRLFMSKNYPLSLPGIHIVVDNSSFKLANYIKLSILSQLVGYIVQNGIIGDCMIFNIIEWLEENISRVIDNPGPLLPNEIAQNASTSNEKSKSANFRKSKTTSKFNISIKDVESRKKAYATKLASTALKASVKKRMELPAWKKKDDLVAMINSNKVTLVTGETGSGKSTQIVQFILDDMNSKGNFAGKIMCTQPRRISTLGLADRISEERVDTVGKETGYIIRGENKTSKETRISFVTTGVLLRMLQSFLSAPNESSIFDELEYIFIDEVHERSVDSDFLLIILKRTLKRFPNLRIILMSATISVDTFKNFFSSPLNHIHIEGRTFPIQDFHLDSILDAIDYTVETASGITKPRADSHFFESGNINYDLIAKLCLHIDEKLEAENNHGSILIFLPGIMEINQCISLINKVFANKSKDVWTLPLHSALSSNDQKRVFKVPSKGTRKIVVSTNVAETSITIPDCVVVVDSGRSKTMFYDAAKNTTRLIENWCSKAEIGQRRGRSGRIQKGNCYHLYTQDTENKMKPQPVPEIMRTRLENLYLIVKSMGIKNVEEFLKSGIDAPDSTSLATSKKFLKEIGALDLETENLSNLGKYLSYLPTDLQSGKLLILGCIFGCLDICLTLASISSSGSPFLNNAEARPAIKKKRREFSNNQGDFIAMANAYAEYDNLRRNGGNTKKFITENYLSYLTLNDISSTRAQYISLLKDMGFVPLGYTRKSNNDDYDLLNRNSENYAVIRAIITGSFYPQIARVQLPDPKYVKSAVGSIAVDPEAALIRFWKNEPLNDKLPANRARVHNSSVIFDDNSVDSSISEKILEEATDEDGNLDVVRARELFDLTPQVPKTGNALLKSPFVVYGKSHSTFAFFLTDITPTSTIATLLFGGKIAYNLSQQIEKGHTGIVLDNWLPIRTWCKNGVLIKRLRKLVDGVIEDRLSSPQYASSKTHDSNDDVLSIVESVLAL